MILQFVLTLLLTMCWCVIWHNLPHIWGRLCHLWGHFLSLLGNCFLSLSSHSEHTWDRLVIDSAFWNDSIDDSNRFWMIQSLFDSMNICWLNSLYSLNDIKMNQCFLGKNKKTWFILFDSYELIKWLIHYWFWFMSLIACIDWYSYVG